MNINILPSYPTRVDIKAPNISSEESKDTRLLKIPGFRHVAVKEYGEWHVSNISDEALKATFRQASDVTLSDGFDLEHGIKPGIARSVIENIRELVENIKKAVPVLEVV
ncbi:hypothetical protein N7512_005579 [Penicillium capsulatum]|nr:hypothetical protein N7512_005579 [Penicillium capsulatum]